MNKIFVFLCCIFTMLTSCSHDELENSSASRKTTTSQVRWYGSKSLGSNQLRGAADGSKRWNQNAGIYIKFINTPSDVNIINKVKRIASEWENYAGIKFHFVEKDKKADVRIAFDWDGNDWLTWSYTGTDAKWERDQNKPTAMFGGLEYLDDKEFNGDVLRLFGQILGLEYEQRHQDWSYWKSEDKLQSYWEDLFEGVDMNWPEIREYVFVPLTEQNSNQLFETTTLDEQSIMVWPYYTRKQTTRILANYELSENDKSFIARLYPKDSNALPTIQKAWVDAGYFKWTDETKTALRITYLGVVQEYLPDVCDGEQLTSAAYMFYYDTGFSYSYSKLKRVPLFNTSNITDFTSMFYYSEDLEEVPKMDTSKGVNFSGMFAFCDSLTTIPVLDTSNGLNFSGMFVGDRSLTSIPYLNTSKGVDFSSMFFGATSLMYMEHINTSNGENFDWMFQGCEHLISIPQLDTSKGLRFASMFKDCKLLVHVPLLDTSRGLHFDHMFDGCTSVREVYLLNTSKGTSFDRMFRNCISLIGIPSLDLSNAKYANDMYKGTPFE